MGNAAFRPGWRLAGNAPTALVNGLLILVILVCLQPGIVWAQSIFAVRFDKAQYQTNDCAVIRVTLPRSAPRGGYRLEVANHRTEPARISRRTVPLHLEPGGTR